MDWDNGTHTLCSEGHDGWTGITGHTLYVMKGTTDGLG